MATSVHGQLTAGQVATVQVDASLAGLEILNRDQEHEMWVRLDGTDPAPNAPGSYVVLGARAFTVRRGTWTVKLISDYPLHYSVEAA